MKQLLLGCLLFIFASSIFALGSFTDSELVSLDTVLPELQLISPNGGESWYIGDTRDIIWTATDPNLIYDSINLDYSLNGGPIAETSPGNCRPRKATVPGCA